MAAKIVFAAISIIKMSYLLRPVSIIFAVSILVSAILSWYFLAILLENPVNSYTNLIAPVALFVIMAGLLALSFFAVETKTTSLIFSLLSLLPFFIFFNFNAYYFSALILFLLVFLLAYQKIKKEKELLIKLDIGRSVKKSLGIIFTVLFFIISAAYYFSPNVQETARGELKLPRNIFDLVWPWTSGILQERIPGFSPSQTVDENLSQMFDPQIKELFKKLPKSAAEREKQKFLAEQRKELSKQFGVELKENTAIVDIVYDFINHTLNLYLENFKILIPAILSSGLFLTLFAFKALFKWLAGIFAFLLFKILVYSGIIILGTVKKDKEIIYV